MNVILDVNVWISALLWGGIPAQVIITGDLDLLVLVEFNHIPILNPQTFLEQYFSK